MIKNVGNGYKSATAKVVEKQFKSIITRTFKFYFVIKTLTAESFDRLLDALSADKTEASIAYARLRDSLVRFFQIKGDAAPETAADETLDRVALKLARNAVIDDVRKYSFGAARLIFLERLRAVKKEKLAVEEYYAESNLRNESRENAESSPLQECFESLENDKKVLMKNYFADLPHAILVRQRQRLAADERVSIDQLRIKICRLRQRLKECVRNKLGK